MKYANHYGYTDINPFEIVKSVSPKCFEIRKMDAEKNPAVKTTFTPGGFSAHSDNAQDWFITSNEENPVIRIRLNVKGVWKDKRGNRYGLSETPTKYYDYNF